MRRQRLFSFIAALIASASLAVPAFADTRVIVYPNQTPASTQQNSNARFQRIVVGDFMRDSFGNTVATAGTFGNLTVAPGTGLFVTVGPKANGTDGRVYQQGQNDPNPLPTGGVTPALAADTTVTMISGAVPSVSSPLGPLTAPGTSNSVYYLIESQLSSADGNPQSELFVQQNGNGSATQTFATVNTNRVDAVAFQVKAGTASTTPSKPTVDTGWVAIGYVLVPNGKTQILTTDITLAPSLSGFVQNSDVVHVSPTSSPSPDSGNAAVSGTFAANQLISKVTTGTPPLIVSSTTQVANLNAASAGTLSPLPTPTTAAPITLTGTWPNQTIACATCVTGVTGTGNAIVTGTTTPVVSVTAAPTFNNVTISNTTTLSALASGCLQVNGSGVVSTTACGGAGGVSAVTGTAPIVSSGGTTPAISCATCVTLNPGSPQTGAISNTGNLSTGGGTLALTATGTNSITSGTTGTAPSFVMNATGGTTGQILELSVAGTPAVFFDHDGTVELQKIIMFNPTGLAMVNSASANSITSNTTGSNTAFVFNAVNGSAPTGLVSFQVGGTSKATISPTGLGTFGGGVSANTGTVIGASDGTTPAHLPPCYTSAGADCGATTHIALTNCTISSGTGTCSAGLAGAAVFSSATSFACAVTFDNNIAPHSLGYQTFHTTSSVVWVQLTANSTNTTVAYFVCTGT